MKIALLGYGVEGESAYKYYSRTQPGAQFVIYDNAESPKYEVPDGTEFIGSVNDFHNIDADIVIKTPAIPPENVSSRGKVTSVTREFFEKCPAPIIGVTGTKGKGTTCTLIKEMLSAANIDVHLVGNIGSPALDILADLNENSIVVYEMSSFQLWDIDKSPETAVVLLVEPDHLNVHSGMKDYVDSKSNIAKYQKPSDNIIYHPTNPNSLQIVQLSLGHKQRYFTPEGAYIKAQQIIIADQVVCSTDEVGLLGVHNLENVCAAVTAAWHYTHDISAMAKAISGFEGLPHHTERVRELSGVTFYDDSFSSSPAATVAAIRSFEQPEIVIVGGSERNANFADLVKVITKQKNIKKVILIGETAPSISKLLEGVGETRFEVDQTKDFAQIVSKAREFAEPGDVVLLSPGCPSFDMFDNFYQRGDKFKEFVAKL